MPEAEAKPKRLADIINVIGANVTKGITVPKVTPQIPFIEPEIKETGEIEVEERLLSPETFKKARNIYELADVIGIPPAKIEVSSFGGSTVIEPKSWKEFQSVMDMFSKNKTLSRFTNRRILGEPLSEGAIKKVMQLAEKYPMSQKQARSIYELIRAPFGRFYQNVVKKYWKNVISPPEELQEEVQKILTEKAEKAIETAKKKFKPIVEEKMRLPEYVWQRGYRGETLAERARAKVREYNESIKNIVEYTKNIASSLSKEDTAKYIATYLNSDLAWEVAKEIYRKSGGRVNLSSLHRDLVEVTEKSKRYLKEVSSTLQKLFDIKADLLSEVKDLIT